MTTPELRPNGANGTARGAVATIGIEADRVRNIALSIPKKLAKVDRSVARIAESAGTMLDETKALDAASPGEVWSDKHESEAVEAVTLWEAAAGKLNGGDPDGACTFLDCVGNKATAPDEEPDGAPPLLRLSRSCADLLESSLASGYDAPAEMARAADIANALGELLAEAARP